MDNIFVLYFAMVIYVLGLFNVRCDDSTTGCKTLVVDYNVLLQLTKLDEKISKMEAKISKQETITDKHGQEIRDNRDAFEKNNAHGSTYIRWGRTTCPSGSTEVYKGYTAGSFYEHSGAAARPLCLTTKPTWLYFTTKEEPVARIYGAEYQTQMYSKWSYLHNHDVPCVVCRVPHNDVLMVPGTSICPNSYSLQYNGYLMAGKFSHPAATDYICVDGRPETIDRSYENSNGFLLYFVQARCGSLSCGPYVHNREVTCSVCTFS
ncbi:uncharacterized protein LOC132735751 [Ruditapes philippinarum]|uniref:uncharacterized protein LOC132735751 n=1 Tax=Ruditapes philippinarum TaxID=129788 RepID=UPI00295ACA4A|nr:uncharacterized protein LOC132735751 [Ruditapes philippinarum]